MWMVSCGCHDLSIAAKVLKLPPQRAGRFGRFRASPNGRQWVGEWVGTRGSSGRGGYGQELPVSEGGCLSCDSVCRRQLKKSRVKESICADHRLVSVSDRNSLCNRLAHAIHCRCSVVDSRQLFSNDGIGHRIKFIRGEGILVLVLWWMQRRESTLGSYDVLSLPQGFLYLLIGFPYLSAVGSHSCSMIFMRRPLSTMAYAFFTFTNT
jgi:hypothetical protein